MISSLDSVYLEGGDNKAGGKNTFQKIIFMIGFTDYEEGSVESWLKGKVFEFKRDAKNRKNLILKSVKMV